MRLICPNCLAQYEVPADVIPAEGRDVQCSNCQETWFQTYPDTAPQSDAVPEPEPIDDAFEHSVNQELDTISEDDTDITPSPTITHERSKREIDPSVADILREEAQREREKRAAETFEHQDEFTLDAGEPRSDTQPKKSGYIDPNLDDLDEMYKDKASDAPTSRRDPLPDIEEINSTLRRDKKSTGTDESEILAQKNASGRRGFRAAIILVLLAVIVYAYADVITANLPQIAPYLDAYVVQINQWRAALSDQTSGFLTWLQAQADQARARNS